MAGRLPGELDQLHKAMGEPNDDALVFCDPVTGGPLDKTANLRRYRRTLKAAALDTTHNLHGLRHSEYLCVVWMSRCPIHPCKTRIGTPAAAILVPSVTRRVSTSPR